MVGPIQKNLEQKLKEAYSPSEFELLNESHQHSVPENSETHFKLFMVSERFEGLSRVARQREVFQVVSEELAGPVHAFSLRLLTPLEWESQAQAPMPQSPNCRGGSKKI